MDLQKVGSIKFSDFIPRSDVNKDWNCYLSKCSPLAERKNGQNRYAAWLASEEAGSKGLYIWLHMWPDGARRIGPRYRFVHVGLAKHGDSTLARRTKEHCRNAFKIDPTYRLNAQDGKFGHLERVCPHVQPGVDQESAEQFLRQIHVLLLIPPKPDPCAIAQMEGLIAYAAACALGKDQITNTMGHVQPLPDETKLAELVKRLNDVVPMLPE